MEVNDLKISVIGAGYVGLITALVLADMDHTVVCVDKDELKINKLNHRIPPIYEEGLEELLDKCLNSKTITFSTDIATAIKTCDVLYIAVGTPALEDGHVDMSQSNVIVDSLAKHLDHYAVIINKSTVPIGTQKHITQTLLEKGVSKELFDVVSNPEFLREGKAIHDFKYADRIVLGCESDKAKAILKQIYDPFVSPKIYTTPETSELIKYAANAFLATKISFINDIANLCSKTHADIAVIAYALGLDHRISPEFFKAGIGYGGSCFPKDTRALVKIAEHYEIQLKIVQSAIEINESQKLKPVKLLLNHWEEMEGKIVTILGVTFKPETDDVRDAPSIAIINKLIELGAQVRVYDPIGNKNAQKICPKAQYFEELYHSIDGAHCLILCTEWEEFHDLDFRFILKHMRIPMIIDGRNFLTDRDPEDDGILYFTVGGSI